MDWGGWMCEWRDWGGWGTGVVMWGGMCEWGAGEGALIITNLYYNMECVSLGVCVCVIICQN